MTNKSIRDNLPWRLSVLATLVLLIVACASPARRLDDKAAGLGFIREVVRGAGYDHVIYRNTRPGSLLHVYLEGDGMPWIGRYFIASDPTPRRPLVLLLMAQDETASLYLGRPCYHGYAALPLCSKALWTARRYSAEVVDSMAAALEKVIGRGGYEAIVFIGYSGGGTLAMLLAERFTQIKAVLTIAGNLDPPRWTAWHGYSPLTGSLNPAARSPLPASVVQLHILGRRDVNIPGHLVMSALKRQPQAQIAVIESFDHTCCWQTSWLSILADLKRLMASPSPI